jgi:hypothetical protein
MKRGLTSKWYITKLKRKNSKTLHTKTHHECVKGHACNYLYQSRSCYSNCRTKDNASSHKAAILRKYLKRVKVVALPNPPYTLDRDPCDFSYFRDSNNTLLEKNINRETISVRLFSSIRTEYLEKIMKTLLKIGLKYLNFVYHMVVSILKDWDNYFGIVC